MTQLIYPDQILFPEVTMLPDQNIYKLQAETAYITCSVETPHDIIGFHVVHDNKFTVEGAWI